MLDHDSLIVVLNESASFIENIAYGLRMMLKHDAYEALIDEVGVLRAVIDDLQHQKDTIDSERLHIRYLSESRRH